MSIINLSKINRLCIGNHRWKQIETDMINGQPTKYRCVDCPAIYELNKRDVNPNDYFDKKNSIFNRIKENNQKIGLFMLKPIGLIEKTEMNLLTSENSKLKLLLNLPIKV